MGIWDLWNRKSSKDFAKDRLKLLLVSDRAGCSSAVSYTHLTLPTICSV